MNEVEFEGQNLDEKIIKVIKRHPWYFFSSIVKIAAMWLVFFVFFKFFWASWPTSYLFFVVLIISLYIIASKWFCWSNTLYLISNQRLILVEQNNWFSRELSETALANILYISHKINGPARTMLNFGSVNIRASGVDEEEIVLCDVANPYIVQQLIVKTQHRTSATIPTTQIQNDDKEFEKKLETIKKQIDITKQSDINDQKIDVKTKKEDGGFWKDIDKN